MGIDGICHLGTENQIYLAYTINIILPTAVVQHDYLENKITKFWVRLPALASMVHTKTLDKTRLAQYAPSTLFFP
jgi:hypothetical protein